MINPVQREGTDGLTAMTRYGILSSGVGLLAFGAFMFFSFVEVDLKMSDMALAVGVVAQWLLFLLLFLPARRLLMTEAAIAWDAAQTPKALIAGALGEAGWMFLFVGGLMGLFVTGSLEALGYATEVVIAGLVVGILLPGSSVLLTVVFLLKGARNARG
ncbi:hypothetical protein KHP62_05890 [Rhodobacteraceae bacterium NNCM2]|nr:hypothetical protein [Coraliihabitans acroporae]